MHTAFSIAGTGKTSCARVIANQAVFHLTHCFNFFFSLFRIIRLRASF